MSWSAEQYLKFEDERNRPIRDLLRTLPDMDPAAAVDIGCGPGNSTELLLQRFPHAVVAGIDSSPDMIAAARQRLPDIEFTVDNIAAWSDPGPYDLILANAALQWVPDHERLMPALVAKLSLHGCLAVQMPDNLDDPSHRLMREVAADGPWAAKLSHAAQARAQRRSAEWYFQLLRGIARVNIWRTTYHHPLAGGAAAVVEWVKGTGLRPFIDLLDDAERTAFLARYQREIEAAYPAYPDGTVLLPFPRLFIVASR